MKKNNHSLSNIVELTSSFKRSVNVESDYQNSSILNNIHITAKFEQETIDLLKSILDDNSNHRVRVLSGSPGLGKSTYALFAANLVSKKNPRIIKRILASNDNKRSAQLIKLFESFQRSKKSKLLPLFLNGYMGNIEDAFVEKLQIIMQAAGHKKQFEGLLKEVSTSHLSIIRKWKMAFPEIHKRYRSMIEQEGQCLTNFEKRLRLGSSSSRELFEQVYSEITGGASFWATSRVNIIDLFQKCITLLSKNGYAGIYVIYDEFGKYLEKGIHNPSLLNVQFLQSFAEYCDRSKKKQCHLILITHLSVSQYATKLPINIQKEWAKIEGRFQESSFFDRSASHYKMISMVFKKNLSDNNKSLDKKWQSYIKSLGIRLQNGKIGLNELFTTPGARTIIKKCYPLHPVVLGILPSLAQKVAQNERTLYTFLTRDEENSLRRFIENSQVNEGLELLGFTYLYEYFAPLIAKDTGIGGSYKIQLIYEESCNKIDSSNKIAKEIISLVSLLSVVKNSRLAPASEDFILACMGNDYSEKEVKREINFLVEKKVFFINRIKRQFELIEGCSIDINDEIKSLKEKKLTSVELVRLIKNYIKTSYVIPNKYSFEKHIVRFYREEIISFEELVRLPDELHPNYGKEDGILYYVVPFSKDELDKARAIITNRKDECIVFILPQAFIECSSDLEELNAVNALYTNSSIMNASYLVKKELDRHKGILIESVKKLLSPLLGKTSIKAKCFYPKTKKKISINHFSQLNRFLGNIFELEYKYSINFNSEYTNRHKIIGNIALARKTVIHAIIENKNEPNFGLTGNGPDVAIAKAVKKINQYSLRNCLKSYRELISAKSGASAETITRKFMAPPFGVRRGVLPLLVSIWDRLLEGPVGHYCEGRFITLVDSDHYDMMFKQPKICHVQYTEISKVKICYMNKIGKIFGDTLILEIRDLLSLIYGWRKKIPDYTKVSHDIEDKGRKFLVLIDTAREPELLIFEKIPEFLGCEKITDKIKLSEIDRLAFSLEEIISSINQAYFNLLIELNEYIVEAIQFLQKRCLNEKPFSYAKGVNVAKVFQATFGRLNENIRNYPFSSTASAFIGRVNGFDYTKHPQYFIETIGDVLTNSNPRNWNVNNKALFEFSLKQALNEIEAVAEFQSENTSGESAFAFINKNTGEKNLISLGVINSLDEKLRDKATQVEILMSDLSEKERTNLLVGLLRKKTTSTEKLI